MLNIYFDTYVEFLTANSELNWGVTSVIMNSNTASAYQIKQHQEPNGQPTLPGGKSQLLRALYADDMFVIFRTKEALQTGMEIAETVFTRYGLTLSKKR